MEPLREPGELAEIEDRLARDWPIFTAEERKVRVELLYDFFNTKTTREPRARCPDCGRVWHAKDFYNEDDESYDCPACHGKQNPYMLIDLWELELKVNYYKVAITEVGKDGR